MIFGWFGTGTLAADVGEDLLQTFCDTCGSSLNTFVWVSFY